jgi:hypothetical protein
VVQNQNCEIFGHRTNPTLFSIFIDEPSYQLKEDHVSQLFKTENDPMDKVNYRPISVLLIFLKVLSQPLSPFF